MSAARQSHLVLLALVAMAPMVFLGCGYTVGRSFDAPVQTVVVPTFNNESFRRNLAPQLTEAVHREIQNRTPFRIVNDVAHADTRLTGTIINAHKNALTRTPFGDPRQLQMQLFVRVQWEDLRTGEILSQYQIPVIPGARSLVSKQSFAPATGQSRATAERAAVENMARQIVDLMESPW